MDWSDMNKYDALELTPNETNLIEEEDENAGESKYI